jgi:hypothetical protein
MSIDKDGWLDWAVKRPGPPNKVYAEKNEGLGLALHSVEGWLSGAFGELDNPNRQASWHFTNSISGVLYQHYPVAASCWASGSEQANTRYWAVESEGVKGTPLNPRQVSVMMRLSAEFEVYGAHGFPAQREEPRTLWEHNELATKWSPNAGPTACPSDRYDTFYAELEKEKEPVGMTPAELARMERLEDIVKRIDNESIILGPDGIGYSILDSLRRNSDAINNHIDGHAMGPQFSSKVTGTFEGVVTGGE